MNGQPSKRSDVPRKNRFVFAQAFLVLSLVLLNFGFRFWPSKHREPVNLGWIDAYNEKAFQIFQSQVKNASPQDNLLVSPLLILRDQSLSGSPDVLEVPEIKPEEQPKVLNLLKELFLKNRNYQADVLFQEKIWRNTSLPETQNSKKLSKQYHIDYKKLRFTKYKTTKKITAWMRKNSRSFTSSVHPPASEPWLLTSSLFFEGTWQDAFTGSEEGIFHAPSGDQKLSFMKKAGYHGYLHEDDFEALDLRYGDGKLSLLIFLPEQGISLSDFLSTLNPQNWKKWNDGFLERTGEIQVPSFQIEKTFRGQRHFAFLEMKTAPKGNTEKLPANLSEVVGQDETFRFRADRPFFFAVVDNESEALWLLGICNSPQFQTSSSTP